MTRLSSPANVDETGRAVSNRARARNFDIGRFILIHAAKLVPELKCP